MKKLRLWNGRPYGVLDQVDWGSSHIYVAAYSKADARRVCLEAGHSDPGYNEVTKYWSECWGNSMNGIVPERGLWMTTGHNQKPVRLTKEANMEPGELMQVGNQLWSRCVNCDQLIRVNKFLFGSLHICLTQEEIEEKEKRRIHGTR